MYSSCGCWIKQEEFSNVQIKDFGNELNSLLDLNACYEPLFSDRWNGNVIDNLHTQIEELYNDPISLQKISTVGL